MRFATHFSEILQLNKEHKPRSNGIEEALSYIIIYAKLDREAGNPSQEPESCNFVSLHPIEPASALTKPQLKHV